MPHTAYKPCHVMSTVIKNHKYTLHVITCFTPTKLNVLPPAQYHANVCYSYMARAIAQQESRGPWCSASSPARLTITSYRFVTSSYVAIIYIAEVTNPNFDIWRLKCHCSDKDSSPCKQYTDTRCTKALHICWTIVFLRPKSRSVLLYGQPFWVTSAPNDAKLNDLEN